jgi:hypothetical protein
MKIKATILAICIVFGILAASCSASKHACPAYSKVTTEQAEQTNS